MIAGKPSHGPGQHEHNAGIQLLAKCLMQGEADKVDTKCTRMPSGPRRRSWPRRTPS